MERIQKLRKVMRKRSNDRKRAPKNSYRTKKDKPDFDLVVVL
jgi:hypothetical protein